MAPRSMAARCCLLAGLWEASSAQDSLALLQQSLAPHAEASLAGEANFNTVMGSELAQSQAKRAPAYEKQMQAIMDQDAIAEAVRAGKQFGSEFHRAMAKAWSVFYDKAKSNENPTPQSLLGHAKVALAQTGADMHMRKLARASANASRVMTQGAVPLDSMMVGFRTSVAPWNNVLKMFSIPLIKASFTLFSNFFGPDGNAARLCVGAQVAADSTYGVHTHAEFGGINIWLGPAKWDNVPGWSFGTSGGVDNVRILDVADFGWTWTLSREPETVCFLYDICVIDDEALHSNMLQTDSRAVAEQQTEEQVAEVPRHGSTWVQHIWCSPDWENTPLVLPDDVTSGSTMEEESESGKSYFKTEEEWDPESEAV